MDFEDDIVHEAASHAGPPLNIFGPLPVISRLAAQPQSAAFKTELPGINSLFRFPLSTPRPPGFVTEYSDMSIRDARPIIKKPPPHPPKKRPLVSPAPVAKKPRVEPPAPVLSALCARRKKLMDQRQVFVDFVKLLDNNEFFSKCKTTLAKALRTAHGSIAEGLTGETRYKNAVSLYSSVWRSYSGNILSGRTVRIAADTDESSPLRGMEMMKVDVTYKTKQFGRLEAINHNTLVEMGWLLPDGENTVYRLSMPREMKRK